MGARRVAGAPLEFGALRDELGVPGDFSAAVLAQAQAATVRAWPAAQDATDIPLVTVDPAGSRDLDQALHIAGSGGGYVLSYAIADVAAFVAPGTELDAETMRRGETLYFPDMRIPLHPASLGEGAASLLPDQIRAAILWRIELDAAGQVTGVDVRRARVRSRQQFDYDTVQRASEDASLPDALRLLAEVGRLRMALSRARHAIDLDLPEEDVTRDARGWRLSMRRPLPVETFNAQISLLTGMCAAQLMLDGGVGLLRTVPEPDHGAIVAMRRAARALQVDWPDGASAGDVLAAVDRSRPEHVAFVDHAASLLRGAAYVAFDGAPPEHRTHAGIGAPYAHVTAPLRRLADRYASEVCLSLRAGVPVPDWARTALPQLPEVMQRADQLAHRVDRAVVDMTEAWLLQDRVGEVFAATVIDAAEHAATIVLADPPVRARCGGEQMSAGEQISARLATADVTTRTVRFERM